MGRQVSIGLYSPFFGSTVGGGEKYLAVAAEALHEGFPDARVEIVSPIPADRELYERMLSVDLAGIGLVSTSVKVAPWQRSLNRMRWLRLYRDLFVSARAVRFTSRYDVFLSMVYVMPAFTRAAHSAILCQFPYEVGPVTKRLPAPLKPVYWLYTLPNRMLRPILVGDDLSHFEAIVCQSDYVRSWVKRYWQRDAELVFPPIDVPAAEPDYGAKEPIILSVGRFFVGGHSKRHDVMVDAFRRLCDQGLTDWELHLAGAVHRDGPNGDYFKRVQQAAKGYPVHIHPDAGYDEVQDLYRRSSIYWHASGYGVDPDRRPIDIEHFGMTVVEAMSHGSVPVVLAQGGPLEVVGKGVEGLHWLQMPELAEETLGLIRDPDRRRRLARAARLASLRYTRQEFKRRMVERIRPLVLAARQDLGLRPR